ncbi:transmembrane protein 135-like, partial [Saccoglossus kowalevskii]|uniref:Transmembrane protein 135-like n=1 Tax=Saccoglossus kowalevskii TaxID=10224 RepID=A0ABM0MTW0_SACKO
VLIFAASLAGYMYFYKMKDGLDSTTQSALKFIFGPSELVQSEDGEPETAVRSRFSLSPDMQQYIDRMKSSVKHRLCKHQFGCIHYILNGFLRNFWMGYGIQTALTFIGTIPAMFKNPRYIYRYFYKSLISSDSLGLGVFLGLLSSLFRAVCCVLRWFRNKDDKIHGLIAGFISGLSMVYYKSSSIALYVAFKLLELVYFKGVDAGTVPYFKHGDSILYTISTAINLHLAVFEPHNLRPSYWNFLVKLTNFRFKEMNRRIIDQFVYQSSKLYPNYWPKYDPRYLTTIPLNPV